MSKKTTTALTLLLFIIFNFSCVTTKSGYKRTSIAPDQEIEPGYVILGVQTTGGEHIEFTDKIYPVISQDEIRGYKKEAINISKNSVNEVKEGHSGILFITTHGNNKYIGYPDTTSYYSCHSYITVPVSQAELVWIGSPIQIKKTNWVGTGILAVVGIFLIASIAASGSSYQPARRPSTASDSCPFIYSFDGSEYTFNAEPYGGAYCQGLKRTEWCELEDLEEVDGQYRILVTNELNETQYTDELKLVVADHPRGVKAAPDIHGNIHALHNPLSPNAAYDRAGRDILPYISKKDRIIWVSRDKDMIPTENMECKEEIILEFPKPEGAESVNFLANACTTWWGSEAGKRYLELYGGELDSWYEEIDNRGPAYAQHVRMNVREELFGLQIRVETEDGWKTKGMIRGGGPLLSEDRIYPLNISDVPGETLRIKLTPPKACWKINHLAVDYTNQIAIQTAELEAVEARDHNNKDMRNLINRTDDRYLVMPNIGDSTELIFEAPPLSEGMDRTCFIKAGGYYDIHLDSSGKPQAALLDRIHNEPGFAAHYSLQKYAEWKAELWGSVKHK